MDDIPWIGLLAIISMFIIPLLPDWLFEGRRNVKHWPRRHFCAICGAPWTDSHICDSAEAQAADWPVRGELRRIVQPDTHPVGRATATPIPRVAEKER